MKEKNFDVGTTFYEHEIEQSHLEDNQAKMVYNKGEVGPDFTSKEWLVTRTPDHNAGCGILLEGSGLNV